jgi:hypothetical protein
LIKGADPGPFAGIASKTGGGQGDLEYLSVLSVVKSSTSAEF